MGVRLRWGIYRTHMAQKTVWPFDTKKKKTFMFVHTCQHVCEGQFVHLFCLNWYFGSRPV